MRDADPAVFQRVESANPDLLFSIFDQDYCKEAAILYGRDLVIFDGEFAKLFKTAAFRDDFLQYLIERTAKYQHFHFQ